MGHSQIDWINEATEPERTYRKMVIGWQSMLAMLNATVKAFNEVHFDSGHGDPHHGMKRLSVQRLAIASIREIRPQVEKWYSQLFRQGITSDRSKALKATIKSLTQQAEKLNDIRNATFHYGDVLMDTNEPLELYRNVDQQSMEHLNNIMKAIVELGESLRADVMARTG